MTQIPKDSDGDEEDGDEEDGDDVDSLKDTVKKSLPQLQNYCDRWLLIKKLYYLDYQNTLC